MVRWLPGVFGTPSSPSVREVVIDSLPVLGSRSFQRRRHLRWPRPYPELRIAEHRPAHPLARVLFEEIVRYFIALVFEERIRIGPHRVGPKVLRQVVEWCMLDVAIRQRVAKQRPQRSVQDVCRRLHPELLTLGIDQLRQYLPEVSHPEAVQIFVAALGQQMVVEVAFVVAIGALFLYRRLLPLDPVVIIGPQRLPLRAIALVAEQVCLVALGKPFQIVERLARDLRRDNDRMRLRQAPVCRIVRFSNTLPKLPSFIIDTKGQRIVPVYVHRTSHGGMLYLSRCVHVKSLFAVLPLANASFVSGA